VSDVEADDVSLCGGQCLVLLSHSIKSGHSVCPLFLFLTLIL
jgi:hypothetical protein